FSSRRRHTRFSRDWSSDVCSSDLVATRASRFATPGVNIGLWCVTPMVAVSRAIAPKHAMQLLVTGELHSSDYAFRTGLINEIVEDGDLDKRVDRKSTRLNSSHVKISYAVFCLKKKTIRT